MRLLLTLMLVTITSCTKTPVDEDQEPDPTDTIAKPRILILGSTSDSLVLWVDDTLHLLHRDFEKPGYSRGGQVIVADSSVYIAANEGEYAVYYKDSVKHILRRHSHAASICVLHGKVYIAGFSMLSSDGKNHGEFNATYWIDGVWQGFYWEETRFNYIGVANDTVNMFGMTHGGEYNHGQGIYFRGSNQLPLSTFNAATLGLAVKDTTTYFAGNINFNGYQHKATLWKNGRETYLNTLKGESFASGVFVSGKNVFVTGQIERQAVYWMNERPVYLADNGMANEMVVEGEDIYVVGRSRDPKTNRFVATLWKNGKRTSLSLTPDSEAFSIAVFK